jgi:hypothetical protein
MLLFIPRSLCALKRVAAKAEHARFGVTQGIRIALRSRLYRAEATDGRRAMVVRGLVPIEDPPWPGFKDLPDDASEAVVMPRIWSGPPNSGTPSCRAASTWSAWPLRATTSTWGLGNDVINTRTVEGRFPNISQVIPKKRPLFTRGRVARRVLERGVPRR